jgi:hypothetical protein
MHDAFIDNLRTLVKRFVALRTCLQDFPGYVDDDLVESIDLFIGVVEVSVFSIEYMVTHIAAAGDQWALQRVFG